MKLYYTGASSPEANQQKPNLSLGGFKSSAPVRNSSKGALFGDISMLTVKNSNSNQYIGLILVNETEAIATGTLIWFTVPTTSYSKFKVAAVTLATDSDGNSYMEHIETINSKPLYAEFFESESEEFAVSIGELQIGEKLGIWIEREFDLIKIKEDQNAIYEVNPNDPYRYLEVELPKEDVIDINIKWT